MGENRFFLLFVAIVWSGVCFAPPPTERDMLRATVSRNPHVEMERILKAWVTSGDPESIALAQKYYSAEWTPAVHRDGIVGVENKLGIGKWVLENGHAAMYPVVIGLFRGTKLSAEEQPRAVEAMVSAIRDKEVQRLLLAGDRNIHPPLLPLMTKKGQDKAPLFTINPLDRSQMALASALFEAGSLAGVQEIRYAPGNGMKDVVLPLAGTPQLDSKAFADWVIENRHADLYGVVLAIRDTLDRKSVPTTREELTRRILAIAENDPPASAERMRAAVKSRMVTRISDPFPPASGTVVEPRPDTYTAMTIDMADEGDLQLARMLERFGEIEGANADRSNKGVEVLRWRNLPDAVDERIFVNYVYDTDGERLADLLEPSNFQRDRRTGAISRGRGLRQASLFVRSPYTYTYADAAACNAGQKAVAGVK